MFVTPVSPWQTTFGRTGFDTLVVVSVQMSRTKTSCPSDPVVSLCATRLVAPDTNATRQPSSLTSMNHGSDPAFGDPPSIATSMRSVCGGPGSDGAWAGE